MKNRIKRIIAVLLAVVMVLCAVPAAVFAGLDLSGVADWFSTTAQAATEGNLTYTVKNGKATITGHNGKISGELVIPETLGGYPVTSIGRNAFYHCTGLTSVTIGNSVTSIGNWAFYGCTGLTSITIPDSVTSIGDQVFEGCTGLTSVTIPDSVTSIGDSAFSGCTGLTSITIPNSVTSIGGFAFEDCTGLTSVTIGNSVTSIGGYTFKNCTGLTSVTIGNSVTSIGNHAFEDCTGLTSITIPDSVTSIGEYAFKGCTGLTSITIFDGVTSIGDWAFYGCTGLTSITIPNSVTSIGKYAFKSCTGLTSITIPDSVTRIDSSTFENCTGLTSITIPNSVTRIGDDAFRDCNGLTSITIPDSVTSIGGFAFEDCTGLTSITIPDSVTSIGRWAFSGCTGLTSITIPDSVTSIGEYAFSGCTGLTSLTITNSVTRIGEGAFYGCTDLTSITIPDSVTSIGSYAFRKCTGLTSVTIPDSVTSIGVSAFYGTAWYNSQPDGDVYAGKVYYEYKGEMLENTSIEIKAGTKGIAASAFRGCTGLTSVTILDSITSIGYDAFNGCNGLKTVYYAGTKEEWESIYIGSNNDPLKNANIIFNSSGDDFDTVDDKNYNNVIVKDFVCSKENTKGTTEISLFQEWFYSDSKYYNHNLAKLASQFAMLGYADKEKLKDALKAIGFTVNDKYIDLNTGRDEVNYFIASKKIDINGEIVNLVFAGFIGSNGKQWNSNFDPYGYNSETNYSDKKTLKGRVHLGFNDAKNFAYNKLEEFCKGKGITRENTKIIITGHSRGAATADLVAAKLIDEQNLVYPKNLYTYTFATPNSAKSSITKSNDEYKRIFNIINPEDFVVKVLPTAWGFDKFGTTYVLPSKTNSTDTLSYFREPMEKEYAKFGAGEFHAYSDGEQQPNKIIKKMTGVVNNLDEFYNKELKFAIAGVKLSLYEYFQYTLCPFVNKSSKDSEEYKNALNLASNFILADIAGIYVFKPLTWFFVKNSKLCPNFDDAHRMETYCAYMMTMTQSEIKAWRYSILNTVNCPVDIEVYEKSTGDLVGKIVNNIIDEDIAGKENAVVMDVDGDSKSFWLPSNGDYEVKLIGNDEGTMDYTVANVDPDLGETERVNFFDVEITDGLTMSGDFKSETELDDYSLEYENGETLEPSEKLSGDEITSYNINVSVEGNGYATESMTASSGDYVALNATADDNSKFVGWYENGEKISDESELSFVAKGDRELTAKFEDEQEEPEPPEQPDDPSATCTHICHKGGISAFFYKIARFFWKLFKTNKYCSCGAAHY